MGPNKCLRVRRDKAYSRLDSQDRSEPKVAASAGSSRDSTSFSRFSHSAEDTSQGWRPSSPSTELAFQKRAAGDWEDLDRDCAGKNGRGRRCLVESIG